METGTPTVRDPLFRKLTGRVEQAWRDGDDARRRIREMRDAVYPGDRRETPANMILSTINTLTPFIYAKDPDVSVRPEAGVDDDMLPAGRQVASFLEEAIPRLAAGAKLKKKAKRAVRGSLVTGIGWLKVGWQQALDQSPVTTSTIPDAQDNIAKLEHELDEAVGGENDEESRAEALELARGIASGTEIMFAEGLTLDLVKPENMLIDPAVQPMDIEDAAWCAQRAWMRKDLVESRYKVELKKAATYSDTTESDREDGDKPGEEKERDEWVAVWELWDRTLGRVFTWVHGEESWLRAPYSPSAGLRWFPFFPLVLFEGDDGRALSLAEMLGELQKEYDERRRNSREHRKKAGPKTLIDSGILNRTDAEALMNTDAYEAVGVDMQGQPIERLVQTLETPKLDPRLYDTADIRAEMDMISGVQDAMRGAVSKAKTATEASILQQGMSGRAGEIRDQLEDWLEEIFRYAASLILQNMSDTMASRLVGRSVRLPKVSVEEKLQLLRIEIRSGTTGKPNEAMERQQWMELMPVMIQLYQMAAQTAQGGGDPRPVIELMRETLRRFDERIDMDRFFPNMTEVTHEPEQPAGAVGVDIAGGGHPIPGVVAGGGVSA